MQVIDDNKTNYLVLTNDGSTTTKTKASNLNQLLFEHNLYELLEEESEMWVAEGKDSEGSVQVIPAEQPNCYYLELDVGPTLMLSANHKTDLVDTLKEFYDNGSESIAPFINLYESIRGNMVRDVILSEFQTILSERITERDDGWLINGHCLLTFEGELYHPKTESTIRSGNGVINAGSDTNAYSINIEDPEGGVSRSIEIDGQSYRLTKGELEFIATALWAIENTPDKT